MSHLRCDRRVNDTTGQAVKRGAKRLARVRVQGGTANMAEINNLDLEAGRFYTDTEDHHSAPVTIIGSGVRDELFGKIDPIGRTIWVANAPLRVIGLLRKQGSILGRDQDTQLWMPISAYRKRFGGRDSLNFFVRAEGGIPGMQKSMDEVRVIMRARRRTAFRADDPFSMVTAEALQALWRNISAGAFALMTFIASISLVVGGIVIANIMLVSVVERTREDRRAPRARRDEARHPIAVPDRIDPAVPRRRTRRRAPRIWDQQGDRHILSSSHTCQADAGDQRAAGRGDHRIAGGMVSVTPRRGAAAD